MAFLRVVNMAGETILETDDAFESLQDSPDFASSWAEQFGKIIHFLFQVPMFFAGCLKRKLVIRDA